jgi:hypothetical protein
LLSVGLVVAHLVLFLGGAALLGPAVDASALTPDEQARSGAMALLVAALDCALVGAWIANSRYSGWSPWLLAALSMYGTKTFSSALEVMWFVTEAHVPQSLASSLFAMTLPLCVIWPGLAVWAFGPHHPTPTEPLGRPLAATSARLAFLAIVVYPALFFSFGYFVAWSDPVVRAWYDGPAQALPFFDHLAAQVRTDPWVMPFEALRGGLWLAIGWPLLRGTRGPWWFGALLYAGWMAILQNDVHLLPNPLMPAHVRAVHFVETASSNALFALAAGWMLRPRPFGARPDTATRQRHLFVPTGAL